VLAGAMGALASGRCNKLSVLAVRDRASVDIALCTFMISTASLVQLALWPCGVIRHLRLV
jgi:hypothetical protein